MKKSNLIWISIASVLVFACVLSINKHRESKREEITVNLAGEDYLVDSIELSRVVFENGSAYYLDSKGYKEELVFADSALNHFGYDVYDVLMQEALAYENSNVFPGSSCRFYTHKGKKFVSTSVPIVYKSDLE